MNSSESAEAIVKMSLEGLEVAAKITGVGAEKIAVLLYTMAKDKQTTKGKTKLNNMLKSGSPLQIFSLKDSELKKFHEESKKYGVLYTALIDKKHPDFDGMVDIMVRSEDAPKVNRIVERFKLSTIDIASIKSEIEKDKINEMLKTAEGKGVIVKSDEEKLADDLLSKPKEREENELPNPQEAMIVKDPQSELSSENKSSLGVTSKVKKSSVRELLKKLKDEAKFKVLNKESKETVTKIHTKDKKVGNFEFESEIGKVSNNSMKGKER